MERTIHHEESCGSQRLQSKDGVQNKDLSREYVEEVFSREHEVDVVHTSNKDDATVAVARVIDQDTDPELGEVPDLVSSERRGSRCQIR